MGKEESAKRGKVVLATVKGDVHDIGKNLLHILLKNNYYEVIDLGIRVPPERIIEECRKHSLDAICLSGLLVKSAHMMAETASKLNEAGISVPLFVGGAALTQKFTDERIAPAYRGPVIYSKDAMSGLEQLADVLLGKKLPKNREVEKGKTGPRAKSEPESNGPRFKPPTPRKAPDLSLHILKELDLREVLSCIDERRLYSSHLGLNGDFAKLISSGDKKALSLKKQVEEFKREAIEKKLLLPKAIFQFFECNSEGDNIVLYSGKKTAETLVFKRQKGGERLCLSDFVAPKKAGRDSICLFVATCGAGVREKAGRMLGQGEYFRSHLLQALALESAEATAGILHEKISEMWGTGNAGIRVSYGYPSCSDLTEQKKLFKLLLPEKIGVSLSEGMMMEPEASVSALVFSFNGSKYFSAD
jgi:5-methyltetrahydrofolate--homocysteine methyltransferase